VVADPVHPRWRHPRRQLRKQIQRLQHDVRGVIAARGPAYLGQAIPRTGVLSFRDRRTAACTGMRGPAAREIDWFPRDDSPMEGMSGEDRTLPRNRLTTVEQLVRKTVYGMPRGRCRRESGAGAGALSAEDTVSRRHHGQPAAAPRLHRPLCGARPTASSAPDSLLRGRRCARGATNVDHAGGARIKGAQPNGPCVLRASTSRT